MEIWRIERLKLPCSPASQDRGVLGRIVQQVEQQRENGLLPSANPRGPLAPIREARLVFHGLRKSAVVMLLEVGCTTAEVQAITGQSMQMVEHYAKQVNQKKLAAAAILKWENAR